MDFSSEMFFIFKIKNNKPMADLLKIKAKNGNGLTWEFIDSSKKGYKVILDKTPTEKINHGDVWHVELVDTPKPPQGQRQKIAVVRLVARIQVMQYKKKITTLTDYYIPKDDLEDILIWLNSGTDIILVGPKGTGKTSLGFELAKAMGWQQPLKVDVETIKRATDLFGTDAASNGSTYFVRSALLDYIERAIMCHEQGIDTHFLAIFDEINRVHAKVNETLHGLFDDTRQITIPTAEGSKIVKLPPNFHVIGTMNSGASYVGTHQLDEALKDRFASLTLPGMPKDYEIKKLVKETGILEAEAEGIVEVAIVLREAALSGQISFGPSYRGCRRSAQLVQGGKKLRNAIIKGLLGWYDGTLTFGQNGELAEPNSEKAKAYSAIKMKGFHQKS